MSAKGTWLWLLVAACLFAFIYFLDRFPRRPAPGTGRILPRLNPSEVGSVQVRPGGPVRLQIRADRTNQTWQLYEPLLYPAAAEKIEALLRALAELTPATYITPAEMRTRPNADEEYGFVSPQASIIITQGNYRVQLNLGNKTAPGDQLFLQKVGVEGAYVVDAALLKFVPVTANDWRDTTLLSLDGLSFDSLAITNNARAFNLVLQRDITNRLWRMVWPFRARADNARVDSCLLALDELRVRKFVADEPNPDAEAFGLTPPSLELALSEGTNTVAALQFGKSPTNDAEAIYARRPGQPAIFTVPRKLLAPWERESVNDFRNPHLLTVTEPVGLIVARGQESFSLEAGTNGAWRILPEGLPADAALVGDLLATLTNAQIRQFLKDVVNPPELPDFGLAPPARQYVLFTPGTNAAGAATNRVLAELDFGTTTNQPGRVCARRTDETSVYAIGTNDFARLPVAGWRMRERKLWDFSEADVARVTIHQQEKQRQIIHNGPYQWSLAPGFSGGLEDLAVEEAVRGLAQASVLAWVAVGETNRAAYGISERRYELTFELKNGEQRAIEFGNETGAGPVDAAVMLGGQLWIGELSGDLYRLIRFALVIP